MRMLLKQEFKTLEGAQKRAAFETAHCGGRWTYSSVRCLGGNRDLEEFDPNIFPQYTWRLERTDRVKRRD